jgi:hypothetical protein
METELARLAGQPGKWDEFLLRLYIKIIHPTCRNNFVVLTVVKNSLQQCL